MYEVPCKDCNKVYIGETKRTLKVRLWEHKQAVKRGDPKNGIAVYAHESHHAIDWDGATARRTVTGYWQRRTTETIHIRMSRGTMDHWYYEYYYHYYFISFSFFHDLSLLNLTFPPL